MKRFIAMCLVAIGLVVWQESVNAQSPIAFPNDLPEPPLFSAPDTYRPGFRTDPIDSPWFTLGAPSAGHRLRREPRVVRKGLLAPAEVDVAQQRFLVSQPKSGLIRLLPREAFDWQMYRVEKKVGLRGGGAYYSFHHRAHEYGYGSDISFERGKLLVGFAGADYGMLIDLGDTELESISAEDPRASFMLYYKPPQREGDARSEARKFLKGSTVDGVRYQNRVLAKVRHTYLVRSISFNRSDLLVAFRIVSKADDGGLTIGWKILKDFRAPRLN